MYCDEWTYLLFNHRQISIRSTFTLYVSMDSMKKGSRRHANSRWNSGLLVSHDISVTVRIESMCIHMTHHGALNEQKGVL